MRRPLMDNTLLPVGRLVPDQVGAILLAAEQSVTWGGDQPWKLICHRDSFLMLLSDEAGAGAGDPAPRRLVLCGMALFNLRLAIQTRGVEVAIVLMPHLDRPDLLAVVRIDGTRPVLADQLMLAAQIPKVHSQVGVFLRDVAPAQLCAEFRHAARTEQAWAAIILDSQLDDLRQLTRAGQGSLLAGLEPLVLVVGTLTDDPISRLRAGKALQRILLIATRNGLAATALRLTTGIEPARERLRNLLGGGLWPQAVVRIGFPVAPLPAVRHTQS